MMMRVKDTDKKNLETVSTKIAKCYEQVRRGLPVPPAVRAMAWWAF